MTESPLRTGLRPALAVLSLFVAACGGGGSSDSPPPPNAVPAASISADPLEGAAPLVVVLDGSASADSDGQITSYSWDFDDGTTATGDVVQHTFSTPGTYQVQLTITDDDDASGAATAAVTATQAAPASLSGTISILSSSGIDSDVNDELTTPVANDSFALAQGVPNPVTLGGYANVAGAGHEGNSFAAGDVSDFFFVTLTGEEAILLSIGDGSADLDLYLWDATFTLVDASLSPAATTESVEPPTAGDYYVEVQAFDGASNYVLTIGQNLAVAGALETRGVSRLSDGFVPGEFIVRRKRSGAGATSERPLTRYALTTASRAGAMELMARPPAAQVAKTPRIAESDGVIPARLRARYDTFMTWKTLHADPAVERVELNLLRQPNAEPNDPFYDLQWHYPIIQLPQAWDTTTGDPSVIVAVIDTGVLLAHPDLDAQVVQGFDFISDPGRANDGDGIDSNPNDPGDLAFGGSSSFHGTHVAGTVAAESNNGSGVAGVAWNARIMPLRALGVGGGSTFDIMQAVRYAAGLSNSSGTLPTQPADVINMSLGGGFFSQSEQDTINDARDAGVIIVASAGNNANNQPNYPASYDGVVSVSATTITNTLAPYSSFGATVDVAAPGGNNGTDVNGDGIGDGVVSTIGDDSNPGPVQFGFAALNGTSMAAPHIAGVVALMKSVHAGLTPDEFDAALLAGELTDDLGAPGRDNLFGHGLINAQKAVVKAAALANDPDVDPGPVVTASTTSLNFGQFVDTLNVNVRNIGTGAPLLLAVTDDQVWLTATPATVDGAGFGDYTIAVDRTGLADGVYTGTVSFDTDANDVTVTAVMQVATVNFVADAGLHYVIAVDADDSTVGDAALVEVSNGEYAFTLVDIPPGQYRIFAGTDSDNDNFLCDAAEACGAYPTADAPQTIIVNGDLTGLDFGSAFRSTLSINADTPAGDGHDGLRFQKPQAVSP